MQQRWTQNNIPSQQGRTFIVTGANSGLGLGVTEALVRKGAHVVMAVRDVNKADAVLKQLKARVPEAALDILPLDLADLDSVKQFVDDFKQRYTRLDVLINNAGVMFPPTRSTTRQGFELQWGTNHLGHFVLASGLLDLIEQAPEGRIITVSSMAAKMQPADIYFDDLQFEKRYRKMPSYSQSKLANILFAAELAMRFQQAGSSVKSVAAHPGHTATNLQKHMGLLGTITNALMAQKLEMGILPLLMAATDPEAKNGEYYGPSGMMEYRGYPKQVALPEPAEDLSLRARVWDLTETQTGVQFTVGNNHG